MTYYWCKLKFDEYGNIIERRALAIFQNTQELIEYMAQLVTGYDPYSQLEKLEKTQNLTGTDGCYIPSTCDPDQFMLYDCQLCSTEKNHLSVWDIRIWHDDIIKAVENNNSFYKSHNGSKKRKRWCYPGRTHQKSGSYHNQKNIHQMLRLIDDGMIRSHYAADYMTNIMWDPKCSTTENNWKKSKCRHQWAWHQTKHKDTVKEIRLPED